MLRRPSALLSVVLLSLVMATLGVATSESASGAACASKPASAPGNVAKPADGRPPSNAAIREGTYFSYPNGTSAQRMAIHDRVLTTINSTWGLHDSTPNTSTYVDPATSCTYEWISSWSSQRGTVRMATWSFNDAAVFKALANAVKRGVTVQIIAAQGVNAEKNYKPWKDTYNYLNSKYAKYYNPANYAVQCSGACRGAGGTPHSKYFLFTDVGYRSASPNTPGIAKIAVQSSMNLTAFAYAGQWNSAVAMYRSGVYERFKQVFAEASRHYRHGYEQTVNDGVRQTFYPGGAVSIARDPVLAALSKVHCLGAQGGGVGGRTRVRVIQYAIFDTRGVAVAKKLRSLWNAGCNVAIIYSVTSKPVLKILRSRTGRGAVPMKQSVIKNRAGEIVKYNHSKWLAVSGYYGTSRSQWMVLSGSANWSNFAYGCDEQMQEIAGYAWANPFFSTFSHTWAQKTSRPPSYGGAPSGARLAAGARAGGSTFGYGIYKYLDND